MRMVFFEEVASGSWAKGEWWKDCNFESGPLWTDLKSTKLGICRTQSTRWPLLFLVSMNSANLVTAMLQPEASRRRPSSSGLKGFQRGASILNSSLTVRAFSYERGSISGTTLPSPRGKTSVAKTCFSLATTLGNWSNRFKASCRSSWNSCNSSEKSEWGVAVTLGIGVWALSVERCL